MFTMAVRPPVIHLQVIHPLAIHRVEARAAVVVVVEVIDVTLFVTSYRNSVDSY